MDVLERFACCIRVREKSGSCNQLRDREILRNVSIKCYESNTVEPAVAATSRKRLPLLSNQFAKIPRDSK